MLLKRAYSKAELANFITAPLGGPAEIRPLGNVASPLLAASVS